MTRSIYTSTAINVVYNYAHRTSTFCFILIQQELLVVAESLTRFQRRFAQVARGEGWENCTRQGRRGYLVEVARTKRRSTMGGHQQPAGQEWPWVSQAPYVGPTDGHKGLGTFSSANYGSNEVMHNIYTHKISFVIID